MTFCSLLILTDCVMRKRLGLKKGIKSNLRTMNRFYRFLRKLNFISADCVREGDRGEGADEDDGSASLDALGEISFCSRHFICYQFWLHNIDL